MDWGFIWEKFSQYSPKVAGYGLGLFVFGFLVWKACEFYKDTIAVVNDMPNIKKLLSKIDKSFNTLNTVLLERGAMSQSCYSQENSPKVVNPVGLKLYEESGARTLMDKISNDLIKELESKNIETLLELERESFKTLLNRMDDVEFRNIQNFAFEHPKYQNNPLTLSDILFVMALKLRDMYRDSHKEINDPDENNKQKGILQPAK